MSDHDVPVSPFDSTLPLAPTSNRPASGATPDHIGGYRILGLLGEGGMGAVYEAEQERPRRIVALKVIRPGMASREMLKRFELEAQILGRLQHPGIAQVYEAGVADSGAGPQPYFAMEYVRGLTLNRYVQQSHLDIRGRLDLFIRIADAVQYAHQKGVIHRDLKPANILVVDERTQQARAADAHAGPDNPARNVERAAEAVQRESTAAPAAQPKILDFGVARATDADMQATTIQTDVGQLIGTLPYMSPEQVGGDPNELDTRSDVYALGVILYELLSGRLPYELGRRMIHEAVRIIREEEPTRLSLSTGAEDRGARRFRSDLETIVGKSLEKDRTRRYQTANALAADVRRFLTDEPISARPPSAAYQIAKFARRNRGLVAATAAIFLVLTTGAATSTALYLQAESARRRAVLAETEQAAQRARAENEARRAESEAARAEEQRRAAVSARDAEERQRRAAEQRQREVEQVAEYQKEMLKKIDATAMGLRIAADVRRQLAAASGGAAAGAPASSPDAETDPVAALVRVNWTDVARALVEDTLLTGAVEAIGEQFGGQPLVEAALRDTVAGVYEKIASYEKCLEQIRSAHRLIEQARGPADPGALSALNAVGGILQHLGKFDEARPLHERALQGFLSLPGASEDDAGVIRCRMALCTVMLATAQWDEAEVTINALLPRLRRLAPAGDERTANLLSDLAVVSARRGDARKAVRLFREAHAMRAELHGPDDVRTLNTLTSLAVCLDSLNRFGESEQVLRQVLERLPGALGSDHPDVIAVLNNLAQVIEIQGRAAEAGPFYERALESARRVLGADHPTTVTIVDNLGSAAMRAGDYAVAERSFRHAIDARRRAFGEDHHDTLKSCNSLGMLLVEMDRPAEGIGKLQPALAAARRTIGSEHELTMAIHSNLAYAYSRNGQLALAEQLYRENLEICLRTAGPESPATLSAQHNLATMMFKAGRPAEADELQRRILAVAERVLPNNNDQFASLLFAHGRTLKALKRFAESETALARCHEIFAAGWSERHPKAVLAATMLADLFEEWETADPGNGHAAKAASWRARSQAATQPAASGPADGP